jgi:heat shock protein HtpX
MATTRTSFGRDRGLQARMLLTMLLLGLLYVALVGALLAAGTNAITMLVIVAALALAQLFLSDKIALRAMGAREVSPSEAPGLHALVERLCVQADLPKPKVAIADTHVPNAFAMGRSRKASTVCATTGLLHLLEPHELEGVIAHELAHVKNRDVALQTAVVVLAASMIELSRIGGWLERALLFVLGPIAAACVHVLLSSKREFEADRFAAVLCESPHGLADALLRMEEAGELVEFRGSPTTEPLYIVNPFAEKGLAAMFVTHPPVEKRVRRLRELDPGWREKLRAA